MSYLEERNRRKLGLSPKIEFKKPKKPLKKISDKKKKELVEEKDVNGDTELVKWFRGRMKVMGETCYWCGRKVENKIYSHAIFSICHILDKRETKCPSVKTHPLNWICLCPDHHTMFDSMTWEEREQLPFWDIVRDRLIHVYECLDPLERRHFPESVIDYIKKHNSIQ